MVLRALGAVSQDDRKYFSVIKSFRKNKYYINTTVQNVGISKIYFWKKSLMLTETEFIWPKIL